MTWVRVLVVWVVAAVVVAAVHHAAKTVTARRRPWSWPQEQAWQEAMHAHAMAAWDRPIPGDDTMWLLEHAPRFVEGEENQ